MQPLVNINLENYNIEETLTEFKKGGALLHISSNINYKVHKDLKSYKRKETRIINRNMNKFIIESIYKHDKMPIEEFNNILMPILEIISMENKEAYLMGDFKINLINYDSHNLTS